MTKQINICSLVYSLNSTQDLVKLFCFVVSYVIAFFCFAFLCRYVESHCQIYYFQSFCFAIFRDDFFFSYLTDFSYFPLKNIPKVTEDSQNSSKTDHLKGIVDGFSYFHWFSVILFSNHNHPSIFQQWRVYYKTNHFNFLIIIYRQLNDTYLDQLGIDMLPGFLDPYGKRYVSLTIEYCFLNITIKNDFY